MVMPSSGRKPGVPPRNPHAVDDLLDQHGLDIAAKQDKVPVTEGDILIGGEADALEAQPKTTVVRSVGDLYYAAKAATEAAIGRTATREFDVRAYGASHLAADNIAAINLAIEDAYANGGGRVVVPTGKVYSVKPSDTSWIKGRNGVTLDLGDATLQVASDTGPYLALISGQTPSTLLRNFTIRGGMIDQNAGGAELVDIGASMTPGYAVLSYSYDRLLLNGVTFLGSGRNIVALNASNGQRAKVMACSFTFQQGASSVPDYDHSTVYIVGTSMIVDGCDFDSTIADAARAAVELHGALGTMTDCTVLNYQSIVNLAPGSVPMATGVPSGQMSVGDCHLTNGAFGIRVWPQTGRHMQDVDVHDCTIHLDVAAWDEAYGIGVGIVRRMQDDGTLDGMRVHDTTIRFAPDTRATTSDATPLNFAAYAGVNTVGAGSVSNVEHKDNLIVGAPGSAVLVGTTTFAGSALTGYRAERNRIIDAGTNPNAAATERAAFQVRGILHDAMIRRNDIIDTGPSAMRGMYDVVATAVDAASTNVVIKQNPTVTAAGSYLSSYGTVVQQHYASHTHDFGSIAAGASAQTDISVPGVVAGDVIIANPTSKPEDGVDFYAIVASAGTVRIYAVNRTAAAIDPANRNFRIVVLRRGLDY